MPDPQHEGSKRANGKRRSSAEEITTPLASNVTAISEMELAAARERTKGERFAQRVARVIGTGTFALMHAIVFAVWIVLNTGIVPGFLPRDPYPFPLLTFLVTLEMIFLSIFVLISQNRITRNADRRAMLNLQIGLLAEQESTHALRLLERIAARLGVEDAVKEIHAELVEPTDIAKVLTSIEDSLPPS